MPPAVPISSFLRPVILKKPSESREPRSPLRSHPSSSASAVACGLFRYPRKRPMPLMRISPSSLSLTEVPGRGRPTEPMSVASGRLTVHGAAVSVRP